MSGHTPGPWRIAPRRDYPNSTEINIDAGLRGTEGFICTVGQQGDPVAEADAALIVEAVNSHAALVAERDALRKALEPFAELAKPWRAWVDDHGITHLKGIKASVPAELLIAASAALSPDASQREA